MSTTFTLTVAHRHDMQPGDILETSELGLCKIVATTCSAVTVRRMGILERAAMRIRAWAHIIKWRINITMWRVREWMR